MKEIIQPYAINVIHDRDNESSSLGHVRCLWQRKKAMDGQSIEAENRTGVACGS